MIQGGSFDWNAKQQGLALGCYYYGYMISNAPGGWLSDKFGFRLIAGLTMLVSSILTLLQPIIARLSFEGFVASRMLLGLLQVFFVYF